MKKYETFGENLSRLMQERGYTVKELTKQMQLKSTNTIARLLSDKSSPNKIREFCEDLLRTNPLQLVEYEKEMLRESVAIGTLGPTLYAANKNMLYFVRERPQSAACICKQAFGVGSMFISTLDDLLISYAEYASVSIMLQNSASGGIMRAVKALLECRTNAKITIEHYVNANENRAQEIRAFINLLDVMGHPNYHFCFSPHHYGGGQNFLNVYGNIMLVLKCDHAGNKFTDFITFHSEDSFEVLYNSPGEDAYQFSFSQFQLMRLLNNPAKATHSSDCSLSGMLDYSQHLLDMDLQHPLICIRPDIALSMVPPEIVRSTINSLVSADNEAEQILSEQYIDVVTQRHQLFLHPPKQHRYLFSKTGIFQFLKQGKSKANVFGLRDLTLEERHNVVETIVKVAKSSPLTTIHLLKNELRYNGTSFMLYADNLLLIDNYPGFENFDAAQSYHSCLVHMPFITENFFHFAENDLLPNYTYSNEETIAFLESLL